VIVPPGLSGAPSGDAADSLRAYARAGGKLLGLADGVAWLCAAGLLPGEVGVAPALVATHVRVEGRATSFTWAIPAGRIVALAAAGLAHRFVAPDAHVSALASRGQIVLRYCDAAGGVGRRPADQAATVAGICDESGHVIGVLAPSAPDLSTELGRQLLTCVRRLGAPRARS
jgi:phosphoribosylformylglycinamidine synthase